MHTIYFRKSDDLGMSQTPAEGSITPAVDRNGV